MTIEPADAATARAAEVYALLSPDRWAAESGTNVAIELADGTMTGLPAAEADLILRATAFDFVRSVSGRRSRAQVAALDWTGDPESVLDVFSPYAPLGPVDAPV